MSKVSNRGKIVKRGATVRVPMLARGPVARQQVAVDPVLVQNTRITNLPEQESPIDVPQFKLAREPMFHSVSASVVVSVLVFWRFWTYFWPFITFFRLFFDVFLAIFDVFVGF